MFLIIGFILTLVAAVGIGVDAIMDLPSNVRGWLTISGIVGCLMIMVSMWFFVY